MSAVPRVGLAASLTAGLLLTASIAAQDLPRDDVVDVVAIGDGLCVSNVFQSHMVLQRDRPIAVWGWAVAGASVTVEFGGESATATASADRSWRATLVALPASTAPRAMTITDGSTKLTLDDVLVGDVWLLGGQSNMEFELHKVENGALEIVSANYPQIRILTVPYAEGPELHRGFVRLMEWSDWFGQHFRKGDWDVCSPAIARDLSAIGFAFARRVHMASQVPIGVIDASRGGTTVEAWVPLPRLRALNDEDVRAKLADWDRRVTEHDAQKGERDPRVDPNHPGNCYAGMIAPLAGLGLKGILFHQGYNNAFDGMPGVRMYRVLLPEMLRAWRDAFGDPTLPFGILSLCTDGYPQTLDDYVEKMLDTGIYIRAAQYRTFRELFDGGDDNVGFASTYDLRRRWYHPQVKLPAGERIARWALATQYGFDRELRWQPPQLLEATARDGALWLRFDSEVADPMDGAIVGFAIAGEDRRFQPATAVHAEVGKDDQGRPRHDRRQLVLTSPLVPAPVHFRYAWGRNPLANLQAAGNLDLPVATQRSDDWDMATVPLGVLDGVPGGKLSRADSDRIRAELRREDERRRIAEAEQVLREKR
ncbi:MAG: hypothetical protein KDE27_12765 [Planctomycetes bacterium]|nr:hypothetical protein [Planctomycetota bacterium]